MYLFVGYKDGQPPWVKALPVDDEVQAMVSGYEVAQDGRALMIFETFTDGTLVQHYPPLPVPPEPVAMSELTMVTP